MARKITFEMILSEESIRVVNHYKIDVARVATEAVFDYIHMQIETDRATVIQTERELREHIALMEAALNLQHAQELSGILAKVNR